MKIMTMEEFYALRKEDEENRQKNPCCANCGHYYEEYGADLCKYWEEPMPDINKDKCNHWF